MLLRLISNSYYFYPLFSASFALSLSLAHSHASVLPFCGPKFKLLFSSFKRARIRASHPFPSWSSFLVRLEQLPCNLWRRKNYQGTRYNSEGKRHFVIFQKYHIALMERGRLTASVACGRILSMLCNVILLLLSRLPARPPSRFTLIIIVLHLLCAHEMGFTLNGRWFLKNYAYIFTVFCMRVLRVW